MENYPPELAQDAVCQSHTSHMIGLWFLPARPLRLNTNECMNIFFYLFFLQTPSSAIVAHAQLPIQCATETF